MNRRHFLPFLFLTFVLLPASTAAQNGPLKGVVWDIPDNLSQAIRELRMLDEAGVNAVRTRIVESDPLLTMADTLGIRFFQDLPIADLAADDLVDLIAYAQNKLRVALSRSVKHPSARHFGLAVKCDTSDPMAASYFQTLAQTVDEFREASFKTYYVTAFPMTDRVFNTVDFVLLDGTVGTSPMQTIQLWRKTHGDTPIGVMMGKWIRPNSGSGYRYPHSLESQARYYEDHLPRLLSVNLGLAVVFAERLKDVRLASPSFVNDPRAPFYSRYGLTAADGSARPAFEVISGFYTNKQRTFAFRAGSVSEFENLWPVLAGWIIVLFVGIAIATSLRFQDMLPRYFFAHRSYQEAIRRTSDAMMAINILFLIVFSFSFGLIGFIWVEAVKPFSAFSYIIRVLPTTSQAFFAALLQHPASMLLILASMYLLAITFIILILYGASALISQQITPQQIIMSVIWSQWPLLFVVGASIFSRYVYSVVPLRGLTILCIIWGFLALVAFYQLCSDLGYLLRIPRIVPMLVLTLLLVIPLAAWIVFRAGSFASEAQFALNLLTEEMR